MGLGDDDARLDEHDADEWFEIARRLKPGLMREEFDADWAEFQDLKRRKGQQ